VLLLLLLLLLMMINKAPTTRLSPAIWFHDHRGYIVHGWRAITVQCCSGVVTISNIAVNCKDEYSLKMEWCNSYH